MEYTSLALKLHEPQDVAEPQRCEAEASFKDISEAFDSLTFDILTDLKKKCVWQVRHRGTQAFSISMPRRGVKEGRWQESRKKQSPKGRSKHVKWTPAQSGKRRTFYPSFLSSQRCSRKQHKGRPCPLLWWPALKVWRTNSTSSRQNLNLNWLLKIIEVSEEIEVDGYPLWCLQNTRTKQCHIASCRRDQQLGFWAGKITANWWRMQWRSEGSDRQTHWRIDERYESREGLGEVHWSGGHQSAREDESQGRQMPWSCRISAASGHRATNCRRRKQNRDRCASDGLQAMFRAYCICPMASAGAAAVGPEHCCCT